jgi:hypothetical protein
MLDYIPQQKEDNLDRRDKILLAVFIILILGFAAIVLIPASQAQTITMSAPGAITGQDIAVYWSNGSMYGLYNSTSTIVIDSNSSYLFTMVPKSTNPLESPTDWLTGVAFPFVQSNVIGLIILIFLGVIWRNR